MFKDWKYKKYAYAGVAVFVAVAGYFAVDAGLIDLVKSLTDLFLSGPVPTP